MRSLHLGKLSLSFWLLAPGESRRIGGTGAGQPKNAAATDGPQAMSERTNVPVTNGKIRVSAQRLAICFGTCRHVITSPASGQPRFVRRARTGFHYNSGGACVPTTLRTRPEGSAPAIPPPRPDLWAGRNALHFRRNSRLHGSASRIMLGGLVRPAIPRPARARRRSVRS
jgi:hypothetical protein